MKQRLGNAKRLKNGKSGVYDGRFREDGPFETRRRHIRVIFEEFGKIVLVFKTKLKSNLFNAFSSYCSFRFASGNDQTEK
ncbi:MAG: hypothetical protein R2821_07090 [Flavobacteriaceae bacterium]